jgi:hypothetical protein
VTPPSTPRVILDTPWHDDPMSPYPNRKDMLPTHRTCLELLLVVFPCD